MYTYTNTNTKAYIYTFVYIQKYMHICKYVLWCIYTIHKQTHLNYVHTNTHIHMYTYTREIGVESSHLTTQSTVLFELVRGHILFTPHIWPDPLPPLHTRIWSCLCESVCESVCENVSEREQMREEGCCYFPHHYLCSLCVIVYMCVFTRACVWAGAHRLVKYQTILSRAGLFQPPRCVCAYMYVLVCWVCVRELIPLTFVSTHLYRALVEIGERVVFPGLFVAVARVCIID